jgi:hypothetical protein
LSACSSVVIRIFWETKEHRDLEASGLISTKRASFPASRPGDNRE